MGERVIHFYEFPTKEPDWSELKRNFVRNVSKYNVPFFERESESERQFLAFCQRAGTSLRCKTIVEYDGKPGGDTAWLYLTLKDDNGLCLGEQNLGFVDSSTSCPGGGAFGTCGRGGKQAGPLVLNSVGLKRVNDLGLLTTRLPFAPKIYLISEGLARVLHEAKPTGCQVIRCELKAAGSDDSRDSECYQLQITARTLGPAKVGQAQMGKRCPVCGAAKFFLATEERYFRAGAIQDLDFQMCSIYEADNVGQFEVPAGFPVVSRRILDLLLNHKTKGLDRYTTDPPIQYAVVQVR